MKIIITENYEESSRVVADMIRDLLHKKPTAKLGLATGSSPIPVYKNLIEMCKAGEVDFSAAHSINLDEYCGLEATHPQSYRFFMNENLFDHININKANTYVVSGTGNVAENAAELDEMVNKDGVTDLQLLGIGNNGHIAFNEAGLFLKANSHVENLTQSTIDANARFFDKPKDVPTKAITMGMRSILAAKSIVLLATGATKEAAIKGLIANDEISPQNPASFLKLHPNTTIVIDKALANLAGYQP